MASGYLIPLCHRSCIQVWMEATTAAMTQNSGQSPQVVCGDDSCALKFLPNE